MKEQKNRQKPKKLKIFLVSLAVLVALYAAGYLILTFTTGSSLPMPFGVGSAVVLTGSMEPVLSPNDLIVIAKSQRYEVGDIVVYSTGGVPVVHRIISIDPENRTVVTKGDANNVSDEPISLSRIKGKLLFSVPFIGIVPRYVRTVPGMILVLTFLFTLFYLSLYGRVQDAEEAAKDNRMREEIEHLKQELGADEGAAAQPPAQTQQNAEEPRTLDESADGTGSEPPPAQD